MEYKKNVKVVVLIVLIVATNYNVGAQQCHELGQECLTTVGFDSCCLGNQCKSDGNRPTCQECHITGGSCSGLTNWCCPNHYCDGLFSGICHMRPGLGESCSTFGNACQTPYVCDAWFWGGTCHINS